MRLFSILEGVGLGALLMYFYDPDRGTGRRAMMRDQMNAQMRRKRHALDVMTRDLNNRAQGFRHMVQHRFNGKPIDDNVLCERIRAELGRHCTHPSSIQCSVEDGHVMLSGPILADEVQEVVRMVKMMPGVKSVDNQLEVHETSEGVPGLQGEGSLPASRYTNRWTPAECLMAAVAGGLMAVYGTGRRGMSGTLFQLLGAGMVVKAFSDTERRFDPIDHQQPVKQPRNREMQEQDRFADMEQARVM